MSRDDVVADVLRILELRGVFESDNGKLRGYAEGLLRDLAGKHPQDVFDALVSDIAVGMRPALADMFPELGIDGAITVHQTIDWRINAEVSKTPPYRAVVSTNLVTFIASMISTLQSGVTITFAVDAGRQVSPSLEAKPVRIVARDIKRLLDGFIAEQEVAALDASIKGARYKIHLRLFYCALSWALGHELGHIVVTEARRRRIETPFEPLATSLLERNFESLLNDERFRSALGPMSEEDRLRVYDHWLTEINADIIGADLACAYQKDHGPSRSIADVVGFTMLAIHLCMLSQLVLANYMNLLDPRQALASRTHPPMDFRMFCVLRCMYKDRAAEVSRGAATYVQEVAKEVLRQTGVDT